MVAVFDQRIDPAAVLESTSVRAGGADVSIRLASAAEVEADPAVARLVRDLQPGRSVVFRATGELPVAATVQVTVGSGTPSAEGPRRTTDAQAWAFRTYGPFQVRDHRCGWRGTCSPGEPWQIEFTNPVDPTTLTDDAVSVEPDLPGIKLLPARCDPRHPGLAARAHDVQGHALGPHHRRVRAAARVLGSRIEFAVGPAPAGLFTRGSDFVVLDPAGGPRFPVRSVNLDALRVQAYAVGPEDWPAWQAHKREAWSNPSSKPPGRRVIDRKVRVAAERDAVAETLLDLREALPGGLGQVILVVRPGLEQQGAPAPADLHLGAGDPHRPRRVRRCRDPRRLGERPRRRPAAR